MGGIFISYRRDDSGPWAGRINDALVTRFGTDQVFLDVDGIKPGEDYRSAISRTIEAADVVLVVIGPGWATVADDDGTPRIGIDGDVHRTEIESALTSELTVIPVLVGGAEAPGTEDLPTGLEDLSYRNAAVIDDRSFGRDMGALITSLESMVTPIEPADETPQPKKAPVGIIVGVLVALAIAVGAVVALSGGGYNPEAAPETTTTTSTTTTTTSAPAADDEGDTDSNDAAEPEPEPTPDLPPGQTPPDQLPLDGPFELTTTVDGTTMCLNSNNPGLSSTHEGASYAEECTDSPGQRWTMGLDPFGYYYLQSEFGGDGLCFDADTDDFDVYGGAAMTPCDPEAGDMSVFLRYIITDQGDGLFTIVNIEFEEDGFCLEANDPWQDDFGGGAFVTDCIGGPNQLWQFERL